MMCSGFRLRRDIYRGKKMASAKKIEKVPTPPPVEYVLTMTEKEAQLVKALVGRVVAGMHGSRDIYHALSEVGIYGGFDTQGAANINVVTK
jgi:hypothetical protein